MLPSSVRSITPSDTCWQEVHAAVPMNNLHLATKMALFSPMVPLRKHQGEWGRKLTGIHRMITFYWISDYLLHSRCPLVGNHIHTLPVKKDLPAFLSSIISCCQSSKWISWPTYRQLLSSQYRFILQAIFPFPHRGETDILPDVLPTGLISLHLRLSGHSWVELHWHVKVIVTHF